MQATNKISAMFEAIATNDGLWEMLFKIDNAISFSSGC